MTQRDDAFLRTCEPYLGALRAHCYRMLGSTSDCDDVLQDVMLRAWKAQTSLGDPAKLGGWLHRIATNVCIDALASRPRRGLCSDLMPAAAEGEVDLPPPRNEPIWLDPAPTAWIEGVPDSPAARVSQREAIGLAFVAALQSLTAKERAALLLRDVVGLSAEETAATLDITVPAVTTALHRARVAVSERADEANASLDAVDGAMLARYLGAWESDDVELLVALLREDVISTMPPLPLWVAGRRANELFYRNMLSQPGRRAPRLVRLSANDAPAFAFYRQQAADAPYTLRAIQVVAVRDGQMRRLDHFLQPACFAAFGLPAVLAA